MRSDQTWNGAPVYGTLPEMLARDEWILLQMSQYGTPMINITVSCYENSSTNFFCIL